MTGRELNDLRYAAKAAGVFLTPKTMAEGWPECQWDETDEPAFINGRLVGTVFWYGEDGTLGGTEKKEWNSYEDDGDALRLAVKLGVKVEPSESGCSTLWPTPRGLRIETVLCRAIGSDPLAATRRAITRAAAEIGRQMR